MGPVSAGGPAAVAALGPSEVLVEEWPEDCAEDWAEDWAEDVVGVVVVVVGGVSGTPDVSGLPVEDVIGQRVSQNVTSRILENP